MNEIRAFKQPRTKVVKYKAGFVSLSSNPIQIDDRDSRHQ